MEKAQPGIAEAANTVKKIIICSGAVNARCGMNFFNTPLITKTTNMNGKSAATERCVIERKEEWASKDECTTHQDMPTDNSNPSAIARMVMPEARLPVIC